MSLFVDPPSGWKFGFPCKWNEEQYPDLEDLLRDKGYPEEDIEFAMKHMRMWKSKPLVEYEQFGEIRFAESEDYGLFFWARVYGAKGHPVLGHADDIRTSKLVTLPDENGTFETLNTIYKKKQKV